MNRQGTLRHQIATELQEAEDPLSLRDLSKLLQVTEKDLVSHLPHVEKSLKRAGRELEKVPPQCRKCGFSFKKRKDFKRPSRCPHCRSEQISPLRLRLSS